jgi:phosphinothricin acetyltransferase
MNETIKKHAHIRHAEENDCSTIADIYNHYVGKASMDISPKEGSYYLQWLINRDSMEALYVAETKEEGIIGWGIIKKYSDREGYRYAGETSIFLHPSVLNRGYGRQMKAHLMERCRELGYKHLVAKIWKSNKVSINYNLNLGYTIVGIQEKIGYVNGNWIDVVIMQYVFE